MRYIVPFNVIQAEVGDLTAGKSLTVQPAQIVYILQRFLETIPIDEEWYLATYPDVADAIRNGAFTSAQQHFVANGYFEGRIPFPHEVDEDWYVTNYPDVADSLKFGEIRSPHEHYAEHGYAEGRLPAQPPGYRR